MPSRIHHRSSVIHRNEGIALLMVLLIVMAITILSLGFIARTDIQLAGGVNTDLRMQMDQLADSALEHGRGLVLCPQDIELGEATEWKWSASGQQLAEGSSDSYDVTVFRDDSNPNDYRTFDIVCEAYRQAAVDGVMTKVAQAGFAAQLRLDPCVALWTNTATTLRSSLTVVGDVRCGGACANYGTIEGDIFATSLPVPGDKTGQFYAQGLLWPWPAVTVATFTSKYSTENLLSGMLAAASYGPGDPVQVFHRSGDLILHGDVHVEGMLLVEGNLEIRGNGNTLKGAKNLPALYVTGDLILGPVGDLRIEGLVVVDGNVRLRAGGTSQVDMLGGLFLAGALVETAPDGLMNGNDAVLHGNPQWLTEGLHAAIRLDGQQDFLQTADSSALQLDTSRDYTLSVWMKADALQKSGAGVVVKTNQGRTTTHWGLRFNSDYVKKLVVDHSGATWGTGITITQLAGDWHHIVVTRNGWTMTCYLDPQGSTPFAWRTASWGMQPGNDTGHLNLGADRMGSSLYAGSLDEVRIYQRALGVGEVSLPPADASLIGYWPLDGEAPTMTVVAEPVKAAIVTWPDGAAGDPAHWSPAAGAFFRRIERQP